MLTDERIERYSRQIVLPHVGGKGQDRLLGSRVLVVGVGGLGSPSAYYLAAAGVGTLGLVDGDVVELSNLQRQILHSTRDLARPKVESAADRLRALNPDVTVEALGVRLTPRNAVDTIARYDVVVDGTDGFPSKYLVADACHLAGKPYVHAGVLQFAGQAMTVRPGRSACLRCVFPAAPPADAVPTCAQAGVMGALAGLLGTVQALEVIKCLLGAGDLLTNRLLMVDGLSMDFRCIGIRRAPGCPLCGQRPTITQLGGGDTIEPSACARARAACPTAVRSPVALGG